MDILIVNDKAHQLFPDGAPELHPSLKVVKNFDGDVELGWIWIEEDQRFIEEAIEEAIEEEETFTTVLGGHLDNIRDWQKGRIARGYIHSDDNIYDCDLTSVIMINHLIERMINNSIESIPYKLKNNQFVTLTLAEVQAVAAGMNDYISEIYEAEGRMRSELRAIMETPDDIEAIKAWTIS